MSRTSSAEPDQLLRFVAATGDLDAGLRAEVAALGAELDQVHRSCADFCGPFARLDHDLDDLVRSMDQVARGFLDVGLRFLAADTGRVWPGSTVPFTATSFDDFWRRPELIESLPPPLALLILIAEGLPLDRIDLQEIGHAVLGLPRAAKSAVDAFGRLVGTPMSILSSPRVDWIAEELAKTSAARRVLGGVARFSTGPIGGAAQSALLTLTLLEDGNRIIRDGNPITAWQHKGAGYIADLAGAGFDVSSTACANEPNLATCGTAAGTGAVWAAAEAWQHRAGLAEGADVATHLAIDDAGRVGGLVSDLVIGEARRVRGLASQALDEVGRGQQSLIDQIRNADRNPGLVRFPPIVTHAIADTIEQADHAVKRAGAMAGHAVDRAGDMAETAADEAGHVISSGLHVLGL